MNNNLSVNLLKERKSLLLVCITGSDCEATVKYLLCSYTGPQFTSCLIQVVLAPPPLINNIRCHSWTCLVSLLTGITRTYTDPVIWNCGHRYNEICQGFLVYEKQKYTFNFQMTKKNYLPILSQKNIPTGRNKKTLSGFSITAFPNSSVGLILQTLPSNSFFVSQLWHWHAILKRHRRRNIPQVLSKSHQRSQRWVKRWRGGPIHSTTKISNPPRPQLWLPIRYFLYQELQSDAAQLL